MPVRSEIQNHVQYTVPVATEDASFAIWVAAPGYQPQVLQFPIGVPCDIEDALEATERKLQSNKLPFCDRLIAVRPQPFHTCAAAILAPDWSSYAALSLICLDLRDMVPGGKGPVITAFVTRPTSVEELRREAGILGTRSAAIFVGTDPIPLQQDESIALASGCLVTFMSTDCCPNYANDLQYRLQFPRIWDVPAKFPKQATGQTALLLLHRSGRYLFKTRAANETPDEGLARFIGVNREEVTLHTPRDQTLAGLQYRGVDIKGVIAVDEVREAPFFVVFLDLRQIGEGVQFTILDRPYILLADLFRYIVKRPPPAWRVKVLGGRRRRNRIEIQGHETLVFGFEYMTIDSDASSSPFDPTTDDDDGDDEDEEEEDSSSDSDATTRSRSNRRTGRRGPRSDPSSDPSYQGGLESETYPFEGFKGWFGMPYPGPGGGRSTAGDFAVATYASTGTGCIQDTANACAIPAAILAVSDHVGDKWRLSPSALDCFSLRVVDNALSHHVRHVATCIGRQLCTSNSQERSRDLVEHLCRLYRLLVEPTRATVGADRALADLRWVTLEMGDDWPFSPGERDLLLPPVATEPTPALALGDEEVKEIAVAVFSPDYDAERLVVEVRFPAIPADILPILHRAREQGQADRFPHLVDAWPQPQGGVGMYVALPHWQPEAVIVLFNLGAVDGRLFAAQAPVYADRAVLCDIADLPEVADISVYAGVSDSPLEGEAMAHLVPGVTLTFLPGHTVLPVFETLASLLLDARNWSSTHVGEETGPAGVYCLVYGHRHRRFHADFDDPLHYRQQLATAIGARASPVHIAPAVPRVTDIAIDGVRCRTVIAVERVDPVARIPTQLVIIDCRAVLEGWFCRQATGGQLIHADLLAELSFSVPDGYDVAVSGVWREGAFLHVTDGSVIYADYVRRPAPMHEDPVDAGLDGAVIGPEAGLPFAQGIDNAPFQMEVQGQLPPLPRGVDTPNRLGADPQSVRIQVLVAVPSYLPELHEITVPVPCNVDMLTQDIAAMRRRADTRRFPNLIPVDPQPDRRFPVFVATPTWPHAQCTILVDSRLVDGRYFAINVPTTVDHGSLCTLADVPMDRPVRVICRDIPWALESRATITVSDGDLITVLPLLVEPPHRTRLSAMLQSSEEWTSDDDFVTTYDDSVWVVTDSEPVLYTTDRNRAPFFRTDLASALGIPATSFVICPTKPPIRDFQDKGRFVRSVILAVEQSTPEFAETAPPDPFVIDMRPIFLDLIAAYAPAEGYDVGDLLRRLAGFCPPGFHTAAFGGQRLQQLDSQPREILRGEVIVVEFLPDIVPTQDPHRLRYGGSLVSDHSERGSTEPNQPEGGPRPDPAHNSEGTAHNAFQAGPTGDTPRHACTYTSLSAATVLSTLCVFWLMQCIDAQRQTPTGTCPVALLGMCLMIGRRDRALAALWFLGYLAACAPLVAAVQLDSGATQVVALSKPDLILAGRPIPTPCRSLRVTDPPPRCRTCPIQ